MLTVNETPLKVASLRSAREDFLADLRSSGKFRYSRYNGLPLRYAGGKSLAVGHVIEHIPDSVRHLVSPFFGGGSVEVACARELGIKVTGYDVFDILTNYWRVQLAEPEALADRIGKWRADQETYARVKKALKGHWTGEKPIENRLELAAHYWFNHNLSYGPGFLGWMSKIYEDPSRYRRLLEKVRRFRRPRTGLTVNKGEFEKTVAKHSDAFLYCDPPYYLEGDSRMFRGIYPQRNFPVHHNGFDHYALRDLLGAHKGGFILSYNDCSAVRDMYAGFETVKVRWQYTLGQGETRIGKNRIENGVKHHVKQSHELLILG